jgi:alkaline phosphatase
MNFKRLIPSLFLMLGTAALASCQTASTPDLAEALPPPKAKNVILIIGDGMGISTITAARIFDGQSRGMSGEDNVLSFERFPNVALVKTYNLDAQVADSAGTASAMNTGFKTQLNKINVQPDAPFAGCAEFEGTPPTLIADLAEAAGMATGIVSTARVTHATPAAVYGHAFNRDWETDADMTETGRSRGCTDLAAQLIQYGEGDGIDVVLGGGKRSFLPTEDGGRREDGADLISAWVAMSDNHAFAANATELRALDPDEKQQVLGLFRDSHLSFETSRDNAEEPGLTELATFAVRNLAARGTGYFLMIESGRIDHAHHASNAFRALSETQELARTVAAIDAITNDEDTLILVTADHSHVFTIAGYPVIGNPILGLVRSFDEDMNPQTTPYLDGDGLPYTTLGYQNGINPRAGAPALTDQDVADEDFRQQSAVNRSEGETHGGEDVALFAKGPGSETVRGVIDQAVIFEIITSALGLPRCCQSNRNLPLPGAAVP